jgi:DNA-binding MarR family transcriptional regulator
LIYHIIHRNENWKLEEYPFKKIARKLNYTPMAITNAIDNLKYNDLLEVTGEKEKFIRFRYDRSELWNIAQKQNLFITQLLQHLQSRYLADMVFFETGCVHYFLISFCYVKKI